MIRKNGRVNSIFIEWNMILIDKLQQRYLIEVCGGEPGSLVVEGRSWDYSWRALSLAYSNSLSLGQFRNGGTQVLGKSLQPKQSESNRAQVILL